MKTKALIIITLLSILGCSKITFTRDQNANNSDKSSQEKLIKKKYYYKEY